MTAFSSRVPSRLRTALLGLAGTLACSRAWLPSHDSGRAIPRAATPLAFASGAPRIGGGAAYDKDGDIFLSEIDAGRVRLSVSRYTAAGWGDPAPVFPGFDGWHGAAQISPDGTRLYFESNHRVLPATGGEDTNLWVADRRDGVWGNARPLGAPFDSPHQEHNVSISGKATICINSNRRGITVGHDILCAHKSGNGWLEPTPLGATVNSASHDIEAFIDASERFLLFASNRPGSQGGFDLYVSVKRADAWGRAVSLGPLVNTAADESNPSVSSDGQRLLFSRSVGGRPVLHEVRFDPLWLGARR